jgi:hypothetical protein
MEKKNEVGNEIETENESYRKLVEILLRRKDKEDEKWFLVELGKNNTTPVEVEVDLGGPKIKLDINIKNHILNLMLDLRTKLFFRYLTRQHDAKKM